MLIVSSVKAVISKSCSEETLLTHVNRIFEIITQILQSAQQRKAVHHRSYLSLPPCHPPRAPHV